jgi:D-glycero-alpha-D-manno-heptose 1-phosphate guanylyltransferase
MSQDFLQQRSMPTLALVLVGGLGTRLRAVLADRPKSLALAAGKPFLHYVLDHLKRQGVRRVILCVGYLADQVRDFARDGQDWGLEVAYSLEQTALGTGGALRQASVSLDEAFFALNGDTLFRVDLCALWELHVRVGGLATISLLRTVDGSARGCVRLAEDGHILAFNEKPAKSHGSPLPALVNGGVYVLEPQALAIIRPGQSASIERDVFPHLAAYRQLAGLEQNAYFADIGTPESLSTFERDVRDGSWNL